MKLTTYQFDARFDNDVVILDGMQYLFGFWIYSKMTISLSNRGSKRYIVIWCDETKFQIK